MCSDILMDDVEMSEVGGGGSGSGLKAGEGGSAPGPSSGGDKIMADSGVAATVAVSLHPLVIMNISEHWTR